MRIRDRIRELRRVRASELLPNPKNWRRHPDAQTAALRGLLKEIGYADALHARETADGKLQLIDGHLRAATMPNTSGPVLIVDLTEVEADMMLATLDPLASLAESDSARIAELLATVQTGDAAVGALLERVASEAGLDILNRLAEAPEPKLDQARSWPRSGAKDERLRVATATGDVRLGAVLGLCAGARSAQAK